MAKSKKSAPVTDTTVSTPVQDAAETTETTETTATPLEPVQLTIADLQLLGRIIDLSSRRGAFQANELTQVGEAYNKLTGFLAYVESVQPKDGVDSTPVESAE